ncbi:MAG: hypothetical protein GY854_02345 [Deltaproteobacteria bacterium]|nr:hypothetical protein [Deltaproteobacteria bacterium]
MTRTIELGTPFVGRFPVFESDNSTKKSGEAAFSVSIWQDSAPQTISYSIAEIGSSGDYTIMFTPSSSGLWGVEVTIDYNQDIWAEEFMVEPAEIRINASMSDDAAVATIALWFEQAGSARTDLDSIAATVKDSDGNTIVDLGVNNSPTAEGVFTFSTASSNLTENVSYTIVATAICGTQTWTAIVGFTKV